MRSLKLIALLSFLFLVAVNNHRAYSSNYVFKNTVYTKYGPASYKESKSTKGNHTFQAAKRKGRPKGIKVSVPQISGSLFVQRYYFTEYIFPDLTNSFTESNYRKHFQRGPPAV